MSTRSKKDERRIRNLEAAKASRQRRREMISSLTEEKARLAEANALLRARLNIAPSGAIPPLYSVEGDTATPSDVAELGVHMQKLLQRKHIDAPTAIDLLDRAIHGNHGRGPPVDPEASRRMDAAAKKQPRDVKRPLKYYKPGEGMKKIPDRSGRKSSAQSVVTPLSSASGSKSGKSSRSQPPHGGLRKK